MSDTDPTPSTSPETRRKPGIADKLAVFVARKTCEALLGRDQLPAAIKGLCEDAILSSRLASPDESNEHLVYQHAHAGQWISHDFRRGEFYPEAVDKPWFELHEEGILSALLIDGIEDIDPNTRTELPMSKWLSADNIFSFDKPGIEKLLALGMVARRSHELAYETAGQDEWIDDLRSRGVAQDPVYQVTPKAHSLILISEEGGKKTPKANPKSKAVHLPGMVHVPGLANEAY